MGAVSLLQAHPRHPLAQSALFDEVLLQPAELLVNEIIRLVDEADGDAGHDFRWTRLHEFPVALVTLRLLPTQPADIECLTRVLAPERQVAGPQIVFVVIEQLLEAGAGDVGEFDLGFFEVGAALLTSSRFFLPERADWIIWSTVRSPRDRNLCAKRKVMS
jgi:hypothetical protein